MDGTAVLYASDSDLADLGITAKGDLFALKAFCQKRSSGKAVENETLKKKLLDQIFLKRRKKRSTSTLNSPGEDKVKTRKDLLGYFHYNPDKRKYGMVRTAYGGGARHVDLLHDRTKEDILEYAVGMFFEGEMSKFGSAQNMEFDLGNFKCEKILDVAQSNGNTIPFTLSGYFETTKLKKARLYLMSRLKELDGGTKRPRTSSSGDDDEDDDDLLESTLFSGKVDKTMSSYQKERMIGKENRNWDSVQAIRAKNISQLTHGRSDNAEEQSTSQCTFLVEDIPPSNIMVSDSR